MVNKINKLINTYIFFVLIVFSQQSNNTLLNLNGEYARRLYLGESMEECRAACIDSAKNNLIDNYIYNRFDDHIFSDAERKLCILELKPLINNVIIISESEITRRLENRGKFIELSAEINDNIFYEKVQQIIQ
tara:strand:+ start:901 stop:1299 length:399 start_codon:yes stop_codon:yes gene_type:complete